VLLSVLVVVETQSGADDDDDRGGGGEEAKKLCGRRAPTPPELGRAGFITTIEKASVLLLQQQRE